MQNFAFKIQAVAEKTAKNIRGLLYFAAPCSCDFMMFLPAHRETYMQPLRKSFWLLLNFLPCERFFSDSVGLGRVTMQVATSLLQF